MQEEKDKKYYWIRLDRNFFKRHDIRIIESMENGKEYVLFYLKLILESIDHTGSLRFNELIPYNDSMLATITNTNIDIVRSAVKVFKQLDMLEVLDDQTIYMTDTKKMLGEAKSTNRVQRFREKQKQLSIETDCNVTETLHETEIEIDIEKDIDKDNKDIPDDKSSSPTPKEVKHKHGDYKHVLLKDSEVEKLNKEYGKDQAEKAIKFLDEYIEMKGYQAKSHYLCIRKWVIDAVKEKERKQQEQPPKQNKFNQFPQRQYSDQYYADLEKKLLAKEL